MLHTIGLYIEEELLSRPDGKVGGVNGVTLQTPLNDWAERLDQLQWSALILDADWKLQWTSRSLRNFLRVGDDADLGYGINLAEAWSTRQEWLRTASPESQIELVLELGPFLMRALRDQGGDLRDALADPFLSLVDDIEPAAEMPLLWSSSFHYRDPQETELSGYRVNFCGIRMHGEDGRLVGILLIFFIDVNPNLMSLLVRGDQQMYERMARLMEPRPREAAILLCDLHESGRLSRGLSSAGYFKMVRRLWTAIDAAIGDECGIVGKHAGDGASAFFLAEDLGSGSAAAAAAIRTAWRIHETSERVFREVVDTGCLMKVGLHWGGGLYVGQLVRGSRLDLTALGDEVNEAARVQESAEPHTTLVTKQLVERLGPREAEALGIEVDQVRFRLLSELTSNQKARRDAGTLSVFSLDTPAADH